jgi:hypothetical protein
LQIVCVRSHDTEIVSIVTNPNPAQVRCQVNA